MINYLQKALEELKRADHLIFVSLKYTRTVDVLKNIIERLILVHDNIFDGLLVQLEERGKIDSVPKAPVMKAKKLKEVFSDDQIFSDEVEFYLLLRKLSRAEFNRAREFRRHVTMTAFLDNEEQKEINIDIAHEYYDKTKSFFEHIRKREET